MHEIVSFSELFLFAVPHAIFSILFLLSKEKKGLHDKIASFWIFLIIAPILQRFIFINFGFSFYGKFLVSIVYPLFYGPMAYFYTLSLISEKPKFKFNFLLHLIPILILELILLSIPERFHPHLFAPSFPPPNTHLPDFIYTAIFIDFVILISIFYYSKLILNLLNNHKKDLENFFSEITEMRKLYWLRIFTYFTIVIFVLISISPILFKLIIHKFQIIFLEPFQFKIIHSTVFIIYSYIFSYFAIRQENIFFKNILEQEEEVSIKEEKYSKSGLKTEESKKIAEKLIYYMEKEKPYLREDLRIRDVAVELGVNLNYLSQSLNEILNKNFYQFVNEYRVKEVQNKLKNPEYKEYSLLRIALECGFNSKSSFNNTFRRLTNISPNEFRKNILN